MSLKPIPCKCCDSACDFETPGEPCWGQIDVVDEVPTDEEHRDYYWIHACEGRSESNRGGQYRRCVSV